VRDPDLFYFGLKSQRIIFLEFAIFGQYWPDN